MIFSVKRITFELDQNPVEMKLGVCLFCFLPAFRVGSFLQICVRWLVLCFVFFVALSNQAQATVDVENLNRASLMLRQLEKAGNKADSIALIQSLYLDNGDREFQKFVRLKRLSALGMYESIRAYPKFYTSLISQEIDFDILRKEIEKMGVTFSERFRSYREPKIFLLLGDLGTGGTISGNNIFVCWEMLANKQADKSELPKYLRDITERADLITYIAHETVHTLQKGFPFYDLFGMIKHRRNSLLHACIVEGSADYITHYLFGINLNQGVHDIANPQKDLLWEKFNESIKNRPFEFGDWLYSFIPKDGSPPDLGYFMGFLICESYVAWSSEKNKALNDLTKKNRYKKIYKKSGCGSDLTLGS
jgi:hypothetical protein